MVAPAPFGASLRVAALTVVAAAAASAAAQVGPGATAPPGAPETPYLDPAKAYLFAHMIKAHYGVLYYSASLDGLHWRRINGGQPVSADYHGHASIARGADGRYFLVGNKSDDDPLIRFWTSTDLIRWTPYGTYRPDLSAVPGYPHALQRIGAPKLFFDRRSGQFLLTWHTPSVPGSPADPEAYWTSQRTLYVLSRDLKTFAGPPRRLFAWNMATIDTVVQPSDDGQGYCAIVKDERYPSYEWTTGKTIRISCAPALLGPYPLPGPPLSPNFREAPTLIRAPNDRDWLLYYEQYAGTSYGLSKAPRLTGPWYQVSGNTGVPEWDRYTMPPGLRHGSMIQITRQQYDALLTAFPDTGAPRKSTAGEDAHAKEPQGSHGAGAVLAGVPLHAVPASQDGAASATRCCRPAPPPAVDSALDVEQRVSSRCSDLLSSSKRSYVHLGPRPVCGTLLGQLNGTRRDS